MSEKLDNETYRVKETSGNASNSNDPVKGNFNKIKLKLASRAIVMEVQEAYMEEEIKAKEREKQELQEKINAATSSNKKLSNMKEIRELNKQKSKLSDEIESLHDVYLKFSNSHKKFMDLAKKALSLPAENFEQLLEEGWAEIEKETIVLKDIDVAASESQNILEQAQEDNIFSKVDSDAIKKEVERTINEDTVTYSDTENNAETVNYDRYISEQVNSENFNQEVSEMAKDIKPRVDKIVANKINVDDADKILTSELKKDKKENEEQELSGDEINDIFGKATAVASGQTIPVPSEKDDEIPFISLPQQESSELTGEWADNTDNVSFDGDASLDDFDFSDDPELLEVTKQIEETQRLYDSSKTLLIAKDKEKEELTTQKDQKAKEAQEKFAVASEIIEERRKKAREKAIAEKLAELEDLKSKLLTTKDQVEATEESISSIKSEISGYQASIDKSDKVINSNGGRTK